MQTESTHGVSPNIEEGGDFQIEQILEDSTVSDGNAFFKIDQQGRVVDKPALSKTSKRGFSAQRGPLIKWNPLAVDRIDQEAGRQRPVDRCSGETNAVRQ